MDVEAAGANHSGTVNGVRRIPVKYISPQMEEQSHAARAAGELHLTRILATDFLVH